MHGQIGDLKGSYSRGDLDFYYRTRAALIEAQRGLGGAGIDYDFYRARARRLRSRIRGTLFRSMLPYVRGAVALALLAVAIAMLPRHAGDCLACHVAAAPHKSTTSNP